MAPPIDKELFSFACRIAEQAAQTTLQWFQRTDLKTDIKSDGTEVTDADRAAEDFLRSEIAEALPDDTIIGEEAEALLDLHIQEDQQNRLLPVLLIPRLVLVKPWPLQLRLLQR